MGSEGRAARRVGEPKISRCFSVSRPFSLFFFSLLGGLLVELRSRTAATDHPKRGFWASRGSFWPEKPKRTLWVVRRRGPRPHFNEKTLHEGKKSEILAVQRSGAQRREVPAQGRSGGGRLCGHTRIQHNTRTQQRTTTTHNTTQRNTHAHHFDINFYAPKTANCVLCVVVWRVFVCSRVFVNYQSRKQFWNLQHYR